MPGAGEVCTTGLPAAGKAVIQLGDVQGHRVCPGPPLTSLMETVMLTVGSLGDAAQGTMPVAVRYRVAGDVEAAAVRQGGEERPLPAARMTASSGKNGLLKALFFI